MFDRTWLLTRKAARIPNGLKCIQCGFELKGRQTKFCSSECSHDHFHHKEIADWSKTK